MNELYRDLIISRIKKALSESEAARSYDNNVLKGRAREIFISNLIRPFINPNIGVCTGIIIDSKNNHSSQIDVILYDQKVIPPFLLMENEGVIPYESVLATIEVKSKLDATKVVESVINARSIKVLKPEHSEIQPTTKKKLSPVCYIFAFDSDLKKKSEYKRLKGIVDDLNRKDQDKIAVPISGLCIPNKIFLHCTHARKKDPVFQEIKQNETHNVIIEFLIHLIDACSEYSLQRSTIKIAQYLK